MASLSVFISRKKCTRTVFMPQAETIRVHFFLHGEPDGVVLGAY